MRWVLLQHEWDGIHYDLLVEREESCLTFSFSADPFEKNEGTCKRKPDHRKHYLSYEGSVAGERGTVKRVREGIYESLEEGDARILLRMVQPEVCEITFEMAGRDFWKYRLTRVPRSRNR